MPEKEPRRTKKNVEKASGVKVEITLQQFLYAIDERLRELSDEAGYLTGIREELEGLEEKGYYAHYFLEDGVPNFEKKAKPAFGFPIPPSK